MTEHQLENDKSDRWPYLWLAIGAVLLLFSNGRWIIPSATWLAAIFILRFVRTQRLVRGLALGLLTTIVITVVAWRGMIPVSGALQLLITAGIGATVFLPYLTDRLISPRLGGFASTLIFPLAWMLGECITSVMSPYSTWGAVAQTQVGDLALVQIVSAGGVWGLLFVMAWLASVANWAWERKFAWSRIRRGIGIYAGILVVVLLAGGARLAIFPPASPTVREVDVVSSSQDVPAEAIEETGTVEDPVSLEPSSDTDQGSSPESIETGQGPIPAMPQEHDAAAQAVEPSEESTAAEWEPLLPTSDDEEGSQQDAQETVRDLIAGMPQVFNPQAAEDLEAVIQFDITDEEPGDYFLMIENSICRAYMGEHPNPMMTIHTPADVWMKISRGEMSGPFTFILRRYKVSGDVGLLRKMSDLFPSKPST